MCGRCACGTPAVARRTITEYVAVSRTHGPTEAAGRGVARERVCVEACLEARKASGGGLSAAVPMVTRVAHHPCTAGLDTGPAAHVALSGPL